MNFEKAPETPWSYILPRSSLGALAPEMGTQEVWTP